MSGLKRAAIVFTIVSLLLFADGSYLQVTKNDVGGDTGTLFGNPNLALSAGTVVLISAGMLLVASLIMWVVAVRRDRRSAGAQQGSEQPGGRTASRA
jgi:hypothetical protein